MMSCRSHHLNSLVLTWNDNAKDMCFERRNTNLDHPIHTIQYQLLKPGGLKAARIVPEQQHKYLANSVPARLT